MIRFLWIPVLGTIAALVAILLAHGPREEATPFPLSDPSDARLDRAADEPLLPEPEIDPAEFEPPRPKPEQTTHNVLVNDDGTLLEAASETTYDSVEKLLAALAPEGKRPTIFLINASETVTLEALEAVAEKLRDRCTVRVSHRVPDEDK